jgi:hypothetical protein
MSTEKVNWKDPALHRHFVKMGEKGGSKRGGRKADAARANAAKGREVMRLKRLGLVEPPHERVR